MIKKETLKKRLLQILYIVGAGCLWMWIMGMHFILFSFFRAIRDFFVFVFGDIFLYLYSEPLVLLAVVVLIFVFFIGPKIIKK